ncbi:class I SAM-dependent methyltransferase [Streptomyces sp. NPDC004126]|uniref:class I SAM-dependent methyltransferase n=1 Tax=Streptomyces sp. NPDC004126 TaxID=3390695 RepID=UPI003D017B1D
MNTTILTSTSGYAEAADALAEQYESVGFEDVHTGVLHLLPPPGARVLDIGSGTGRDAAALAALGHTVVAVEPTAELRAHARRIHRTDTITWLDDSLPDLTEPDRRGPYDLVVVSAVWMHLTATERERSMARVAALLAPGGLLLLSLRHGPVPRGRRMFEVTATETIELARSRGLACVHHGDSADPFHRGGVRWSDLAFTRGNDEES